MSLPAVEIVKFDKYQYQYCDIRTLDHNHIDKKIMIQGRIHTIRNIGNKCFIVLRYQNSSLQALGFKKNFRLTFKELCKVTNESIINLYGFLRKSPFEIKFTTYKDIEFEIHEWELVSKSDVLPFLIEDANDFGASFRSDVGQAIRLDNRWVDLRIPVNHAIFKINSGICQLFREFLISNNFIEIHTPKTIGVASEGGTEVFELKYFDEKAYLSQSPQLYKQIAINSDFDRVFEIGSVFRAEKSYSNRHLCEFTGLDLEMTISPNKNYYEVLNIIWNLLTYIFDGLKNKFGKELNIIREKLPFEDPVYTKEPLIIKFSDGVKMLKDAGKKQDDYEDLSRENERLLGELIKKEHGVDLFILDQYPMSTRPFYTMPHPSDNRYSCSYDIIFRCQEISSGAQRINDYEQLMHRVVECGINPNSLKYYLDSFSHGSKPHGGCGFGLERILTFYLNINNIRKSSFCPRDPKRLIP